MGRWLPSLWGAVVLAACGDGGGGIADGSVADILTQPVGHFAIDATRGRLYLALTTGATSFARSRIDGVLFQPWEIPGAPPFEYVFEGVDGPSDVLYHFENEAIYRVDGDGFGRQLVGGAVLGSSIVVFRP